ncbi:MAG: DUF4011 domain-containing protein, partial [Clostridia bacterium]|nr:DUF4011 domain-containing protein [Clostridia bacterium]
MNREVQKKLVLWKKKLLDLGKRNRLLNYKDTKRGSLKIEMPEFSEFYKLIVNDEKKLKFAHVYITQRNAASVFDESDGDESEINYNELPGDIKTFCSVKEAEQTLNNLRKKARTAMEEQGVNILYLSFGFLEWYEAEKSKVAIRSPIILVPVCLELETLNDPYVISLHEDEIVVNPTLAYKLEHDFGLELPEFDPSVKDAAEYVDKINKAVEKYGWTTQKEVTLSLLSFLKINMYNDLEEHAELIGNHPVIRALSDLGYEAGEAINGIETQDHDKLRSPKDVFQVVDADSSQLDAIEMSKQGVSFVLQGPPGTGKSQTITNIIAEALADNKKVLFVSEKMAALEVVHNRLSASGLADFCLVLHSSKANKRELLDSLRKVIELKPISVTDEALYKLDTLKTYRNSLNEYAEQLHKIIEPLGQSLFYAQSLIAANQNTQDLIFEIKNTNIRDVTKEQFFTYRRVLEQFVRSRHSLSSDYSENVWRYCNLRNITHEARHDISSRLDSLTDLLKTFLAGSDEIKKKTELNVMISYNSLNEIRSFIDLCGEGETFPVQWIEDLSFDELTQKAERFNSTKKEAEQLRETVRKDCKDDIFHLNADDIVQKISATIDSIAEISSDTNISVNGLLKDYEIRSSDIRLENEKLISLQRIMNKIPKQAGIRCPSALDDIKELCTLLDAFDSEMRPCSSWFRSAERNSNAISDSLEALSKQIDKTNEIQNRITETWDKSVLNIDHQSIRMRFRTEYGSIFRALKKNYKEDAQNLKGYYTGNKKCSYDDYCRLLDMLGEYSNACEEISINDPIYKRDLGQWYNGKDTDVAAVNKAISEFNTVCRYYNGSVPEYLRNILLSYSNEGMFVSECNELRQFTEDDQIVKLISGSVDMKTDDQCDLMTLSKKTQQICGKLDKLEEIFETIKPYMASELLYDEIYSRLGALSVIQRSEQEIQDLNNELEKDYGRFFNGFDTDWQNIIAKLAWVRRLKSFSDKLHLSFGFISKCAGEEQQYTFLKEYRTLLNDFSSSADKIIIWLDTLFEEPVLIKEMDFASLSEHAQKCRLHLKELEEWIDFCECRRQCEEQGLDDFIETVLQNNVANEQVLPVFIKRFERVWIDSVINECPAVALFRTRNQENTITKFRELDHEQFSIASVRIRERLIRQIPNIHSFTSSKDEVAVLMREMSKQRKIMPVRKLFSSIPMLLPRLKPCLMMSPLSVSLFLQSDHYKFDMVIFDEASQVRTENAIGAISRGTQVIIAGDTHQLPPTSFFTSAVSNSDEYIEEED